MKKIKTLVQYNMINYKKFRNIKYRMQVNLKLASQLK